MQLDEFKLKAQSNQSVWCNTSPASLSWKHGMPLTSHIQQIPFNNAFKIICMCHCPLSKLYNLFLFTFQLFCLSMNSWRHSSLVATRPARCLAPPPWGCHLFCRLPNKLPNKHYQGLHGHFSVILIEIIPIQDFMSTVLGHLFWFGVYMCHCIYLEQITENIMWLIKGRRLASDLHSSCDCFGTFIQATAWIWRSYWLFLFPCSCGF